MMLSLYVALGIFLLIELPRVLMLFTEPLALRPTHFAIFQFLGVPRPGIV